MATPTTPFGPLARLARAWLDTPDAPLLDVLVREGRDVTDLVPEERRSDWTKLLDGLSREGESGRARAYVEGLDRACKLFGKKPRAAKPAPPLGALDPVDRLPGLGPTARTKLAEHGIARVADLLWVPPVAWDDLRAPVRLAEAIDAARAFAEGDHPGRPPRVVLHAVVKAASVIPIRRRRGVRVVVQDEADAKCTLHAFWFFLAHGLLALAKPDARVLLVGRIRVEKGKPPRVAHPELFLDEPSARRVRARYPKLGPSEASLRTGIAHALGRGLVADPVPPSIAAREGMTTAGDVLAAIHATQGEVPGAGAQIAFTERLAWAEAFTRAWERLARGAEEGRAPAPALPPRPELVDALERELGFTFTRDQRAAIGAVSAELAKDQPMRRLLLGDVGTGKTAVALAAAAQAVAAGKQVAILAPTSVLAEQYLRAVLPLERAARVKVAFVAAGQPAAARRAAVASLLDGSARVAIGTHALLGEGLVMPSLALVVVDEQQRLGVAQRLSLVRKGARPHLLTLTATPIPRTLALALRGELRTSTLRERPAGRPPPSTELVPRAREASVVAQVVSAVKEGGRAFWVVPRVLEPEAGDDEAPTEDERLASVVTRARVLGETLGTTNVGMIHGGLSANEKRRVMESFRRGESPVLVGTTVIEVGVDVPEATLMVVEDAELFGLAQLHQLRGRVGRGERRGRCVLFHGDELTALARSRLEALASLDGGEEVARADLELRGAGDLGGTRQHGSEEDLVYLDPNATYPWLERIEEDARALFARDPRLEAEEHAVLGSLAARLGRVIAVREEAG